MSAVRLNAAINSARSTSLSSRPCHFKSQTCASATRYRVSGTLLGTVERRRPPQKMAGKTNEASLLAVFGREVGFLMRLIHRGPARVREGWKHADAGKSG